MIDISRYSITVQLGWFDGEFCYEAKVAELPDIAEYADTHKEAFDLAVDAIATTAAIFARQNRTTPASQHQVLMG